MKLTREASFYNPFFLNVNDAKKEVESIYFFDSEKEDIIASSKWFGNNNDFKTLELCPNVEPVRKMKMDLSLKIPFYIVKKDIIKKTVILLYIPLCMVESWKIETMINDGITHDGMYNRFHDHAQFDAVASKRQAQLVNGEIAYIYPEEQKITISFDCNNFWDSTKEYERLRKMEKRAKSAGVDLTIYQLQQLETVFNITNKRSK